MWVFFFMSQNKILKHSQISAKFDRLSQQLYEDFFEEEVIFLIGIDERGFLIAKELQVRLNTKFPEFKVELFKLKLDKKELHWEDFTLDSLEIHKNKIICLVDDVVDSGKTMFYSLSWLLQFMPMQLKTLALVDRNHRKFPVQTDYTGLKVSTTLNDNVVVEFHNNQWNAFLK
jgi:pyrimidine operon attenuation protein/uracil phosphoribosyltransferase